jgi:CheY-like chemotaxis protein
MPKTILCVDDSVTMQKVAEITFHATEYQYVGAKNADEGLAAARKERPALILVDAVMPGRTGYDLCAALKADADLKDVPVLLMCGNSQAYDPARGSQVGADGHVIKPWDTQVMLDKVAEVLGSGAKAASPAAGATAPAPRAPAPRPAAASGPDRSGSSPASPAGMNKAPGAKPPSSPFSSPPARPAPPASLSQRLTCQV